MSLIAVERIKLFSTRSPWWCMISAAVLALGIASLVTGLTNGADEAQLTPIESQFGLELAKIVMMVMAVLAVTTEYRFNTIKISFQAVPQRAALLTNKAIVVATLAGIVGLVAAFGSWGIGSLLAGSADMAIDTGAEWRLLAGQGLVYAISAVIAISVGILIRQTAGAVAIMIIWPLLLEDLVSLIPKVGDDLSRWAPFNAAGSFLNQGLDLGTSAEEAGALEWAMGPWPSLLYFAAWGIGLFLIALAVTRKRDA